MKLATLALAAALAAPMPPGPKDRCAVCGMQVLGHKAWIAQARFRDGKLVFFDGAKDLMRFLYDVPGYAPGRTAGELAESWVTDYYALTPVPARDAWYVVGSDVMGPMGKELVPFASEAKARTFANDHRGERVLRAAELTAALLEALVR